MIQCALRTKIKHISALSALGTDVLFLHLDICGVAFNNEVQDEIYCDGKKLSKLFFKTYDLNGYVITVCSECETFSENIEWFVPE